MNAPTEFADIDSLLDATLDDLADAPEFKPFNAGVHRCTIKWDPTKKINDIPTVELQLTLIETVEQKDPEEKPSVAGDTTNVSFMLFKKDKDTNKMVMNELAQGQMKVILASLKTDLNLDATMTNRQVMEATNNVECLVVTNIRTDKRDKDNIKYYTGIVSLNAV